MPPGSLPRTFGQQFEGYFGETVEEHKKRVEEIERKHEDLEKRFNDLIEILKVRVLMPKDIY